MVITLRSRKTLKANHNHGVNALLLVITLYYKDNYGIGYLFKNNGY